VAHRRQKLHATISSVVVSRYTRLHSFVVKTNCTFSLNDEFGGRLRIRPTHTLLMCIYPLTHRPPPTYTFNSLVFHPRTFHPCYLVPRFPLPPFQRPFLVNYICAIICRRRLDYNCPSVIANKKAQLSLTNPRDAKSCQNCSNSTCLQRFR